MIKAVMDETQTIHLQRHSTTIRKYMRALLRRPLLHSAHVIVGGAPPARALFIVFCHFSRLTSACFGSPASWQPPCAPPSWSAPYAERLPSPPPSTYDMSKTVHVPHHRRRHHRRRRRRRRRRHRRYVVVQAECEKQTLKNTRSHTFKAGSRGRLKGQPQAAASRVDARRFQAMGHNWIRLVQPHHVRRRRRCSPPPRCCCVRRHRRRRRQCHWRACC